MRVKPTLPAAILVVADDRALRAVIAEALSGASLRVTAVGTRAPVIAAVDVAARFDAVVLDTQPPDANALAVARHLLGSGNTPLIVLTTPASSIFPQEELAVGPVTQLLKPVEPAQLLEVVHGVVQHAREHRRLRVENERLASAVAQARDINLVVGILMERFKIDHASAFESLRRQSRSRRMKLADFAHSLVLAQERLQALGARLIGRVPPAP